MFSKVKCAKMVDLKHLPLFLHIYIMMNNFIRTEQQNGATTVLFNHNLDSRYCVKNISKISYSDCLAHLKTGNFSFNVIVYRRMFLLCKLCYVSQMFNARREPGFVLAHTPISDTSAVNLALNKATNLSSTFHSSTYGPASSSLAVDGNREQKMNIETNKYACAMTSNASTVHWWVVDLGQIYSISKVVIYNRIDTCCDQWLNSLEILVGENEYNMHLCSTYAGPGGSIVTIMCEQPLLGKFVKVNKTTNEGVALCEVEVYH